MLVRSVRRKNEIPPGLQNQSKNVVGGVFKCGQKLYTRRFTSHNIYRSTRKGALFVFHQSAAQGPCDRRTRALLSSVVIVNKSVFGLLCKPTRIVTAFSFTRLKTMLPVSLY